MPTSALISIDSKPIRSHNFPKSFSIHGRLAAHLALTYSDIESGHKPWQDIWPSEEDFKTILPLNWSGNLQSLLPTAAQGKKISFLAFQSTETGVMMHRISKLTLINNRPASCSTEKIGKGLDRSSTFPTSEF